MTEGTAAGTVPPTSRASVGTAGVGYLKHVLDVKLFPELWKVRTDL